MLASRLISLSKLLQPKMQPSTPGPTLISRLTLTVTVSQFHKEAPRINSLRTLVTKPTGSDMVRIFVVVTLVPLLTVIGTTTPQGTLWAKLSGGAQWVIDQLSLGATSGKKQAAYQGEKAADAVKEGATYATNRAGEAAQKASDKVKEEL